MSYWTNRRIKVDSASDQRWDTLHARLKRDWQSAFVSSFVAFAVSRRWQERQARDWAENIADAAFHCGDADPVVEARLSVPVCEREAAE